MMSNVYPKNYQRYAELFPAMFEALHKGAEEARKSGPLTEKNCHLVQLAAALAVRSEGAVHSHARRALAAGVSQDELYQVVNLLISTVGFPTAAAGFSWINDVLDTKA